jgi:hypothetical protein
VLIVCLLIWNYYPPNDHVFVSLMLRVYTTESTISLNIRPVSTHKKSVLKIWSISVFELPGGWGVEPPSCLLNPPKQNALGYPGGGGGQFQPPAVVNDAELPVCNDNDNE